MRLRLTPRLAISAAVLLVVGCGGSLRGARSASDLGAIAIDRRVRYYDVVGATSAELRAALDRVGPVGRDGRHHDAYTAWYVRWTWHLWRAGATCRLRAIRIGLAVRSTLPRWRPAAGASAALARRWTRYLRDLERHEDGHHDLGLEAARQIGLRLNELPPQGFCWDLERDASADAERVLEEFRARERAYDRATRHGATQGAWFR